VVTGFEPLDLLRGILAAVTQLERGEARVENQYARAVVRDGNPAARAMVEDVFVVSDRTWRGLGPIPKSGYALAPRYRELDAEQIFDVAAITVREPEECQAGLVLQGRLRPTDCPAFGTRCTPEHPLGATMVSTEGACAAYFHYRRAPRAATPASPQSGASPLTGAS
jgi:hydrogenase expression/formation protein HypD